ncbi:MULTISPECIES: hypothetical protein [Janthinobacterium]|uniref:hypothetical protein n=1 Tax=Janthinobacterium TaxID=29580 RepID=UPI001C5A89CE|nr:MULTISPECIES: hypothetical protein [Janthinobacterium]MBW3508811.1 hypothetical protein [Janthinobacterium sp. NKUCC06_STL]MCA1861731.1 hypothetical protein [Janthinobacterium lividum]
MASFRKRSGGWRAEIAVLGTRELETFSTKAEADAWAAEREAQLRRSDATGIVAGKTCLQAFERYRDEVSVHTKGARWEAIQLTAIAKHMVADKKLGDYLVGRLPQTFWDNGATCASKQSWVLLSIETSI